MPFPLKLLQAALPTQHQRTAKHLPPVRVSQQLPQLQAHLASMPYQLPMHIEGRISYPQGDPEWQPMAYTAQPFSHHRQSPEHLASC